jgi:hypothetical protein
MYNMHTQPMYAYVYAAIHTYTLIGRQSEVAKAFRAANRDHGMSKSTDLDVHELDFKEFMDCMARLEEIYMNRSAHVCMYVCVCI